MKQLLIFLFSFLLIGCAHYRHFNTQQIPPGTTQALYVYTLNAKKPTQAVLEFWQTDQDDRWIRHQRISAIVGRSGIAQLGLKREGDGQTPSGMYSLTQSFGYLPQVITGLKYQMVTPDDLWIDDVNHPDYNKWVKAPTNAASFEFLKRNDHLYRYAIVIDYNQNPIIKGNGSAIFLHIWRHYYAPTAGCVAISERHLRKILSVLKSENKPLIIIDK